MKFNQNISLNGRIISNQSPVFIIAEAGVNHNGDMILAKELVDAAVDAEVDAVKFQTFKADKLILKTVDKAIYQLETTSSKETQYDMLKRLEVTQQQNIELKRYCDEKKIMFLTTPFDEESLDELDILELPAYKIASTDVTNLPFLKKIAKKKKPIFLSTGMSYLEEIELALRTIYEYNKEVVLLQCTANYPIEDNEANLNVIDVFKEKFDMLFGYSDHTVDVGAAPYAIAKGAKILEKHFTLDCNAVGPDHKASLTPEQLSEFVQTVRHVEKYMGTSIKQPTMSESKNRLSLQKCVVAAEKIEKNELFMENNLATKRTGGKGISPIYFYDIVGRKAKKTFYVDDIIEI